MSRRIPETARPVSSRRALRRRRLALRALFRLVTLAGVVVVAMLVTTGVAAASPFDCKTAPPVDDPAGGDGPVLDPGVLTVHDTSRYGQRGYAGLAWATYDTGCLMPDIGAELDTEVGNALLSTAVDSTAAWQGLASLATGTNVDPAAAAAGSTASVVWQAVFSPWAGVAVTCSALIMLVAAGRAETARVMTRAAGSVVALGMASLALNGAGVSLAGDLRATLSDALRMVQTGVAAQLHADPSAGPRNLVIDQLLWPSWKTGEVGPNGPTQLAETLYENQALTKAESAQIVANPSSAKGLFDQKNQAWQQAADGAESGNPAAYQAIQGRGASRTGAGLRALVMVAPIAWFQILALFLVLGLFVFCALLPIAAPLVGLAAVVSPGALEKTVRAAAMLVFAGLVSGIAAVIQIAFATRLLGAAPTSMATSVILLAATVVVRRWLKPLMSVSSVLRTVTGRPAKVAASAARYRAITRMISAASGSPGSPGGPRQSTWVDPTRRAARPEGALWGRSERATIERPTRSRPAASGSGESKRTGPESHDDHAGAPSSGSTAPRPSGPGGPVSPPRRGPVSPAAPGSRRRRRVAGHAPAGHHTRDEPPASPWPRPGTTGPSVRTASPVASPRAGWWVPPGVVYWPPPRPHGGASQTAAGGPSAPSRSERPETPPPRPPRPDGAAK